MVDFLRRLKQRKIVQWAIAYVAFAFALIQVLDVVTQRFGWPDRVEKLIIVALAIGFFVVLVLAWYHGERGAQRVSGPELLLIALVLAVGGVVVWHFGQPGSSAVATNVAASAGGTRAASAAAASGKAPTVASTNPGSAGTRSIAVAVSPIAAQPIPAKSIAVLPFENLSTDKNNAYFADGIQDLILTKLADIGDLKVISRTSTESYGSHPGNLSTIGQQLGVATILEGSVQKAGKQVLINVQLIDAKTDSHIWAQSYTRTLTNIFGVEGEVAGKVAATLNAKLTAQEAAAVARIPTTNPQAYTSYLKGQYEFDQFFNGDNDREHLPRAARFFKQAVANDSHFALAYAWLSTAQSAMLLNGWKSDRSVQHAMQANARKAVSLQPDLVQARAAVGWATFVADPAHSDEAIRQLKASVRLAPGGSFVYAELAQVYASRGDWKLATEAFRKVLRLDPHNAFAIQWLGYIDEFLRHYAASRQMFARCLAITPSNVACRSGLGGVDIMLGQTRRARMQLEQLPDKWPYKYFGIARIWALERDYTHALKAVKQAPEATPGKQLNDNIGLRALLIGQMSVAAGDTTVGQAALARGHARVLEALKVHPHASNLYGTVARFEMAMGNRDAALRAIDKGIALAPGTFDALTNVASFTKLRAEVLAHFSDAKDATDILRKLFNSKDAGAEISVPLLKLDPVWDPIRHNPAFQALLKKYANTVPVPVSTTLSGAGHG